MAYEWLTYVDASAGSLEVWVYYWWCPLYQGDPTGINWAYGRDYVTSGCDTVFIGWHDSFTGGAWMYSYAINFEVDDGELNSIYTIGATTHHAWDDSDTWAGNYPWIVAMRFWDTTGHFVTAESPYF